MLGNIPLYLQTGRGGGGHSTSPSGRGVGYAWGCAPPSVFGGDCGGDGGLVYGACMWASTWGLCLGLVLGACIGGVFMGLVACISLVKTNCIVCRRM